MSRYLVIAHQTGDSPMLVARARELAAADRDVEFVVLTPRRPITMAMAIGGETRSATQIAAWRSRRTESRLRAAGLSVSSTRLGSFDPMQAIEEELTWGEYDGLIISTLPHGFSAWLHLNLPSRVRARWPRLEVMHVITPSIYFRDDAAPVAATRGSSDANH